MNETIEYILRSMRGDLERTKKELEKTQWDFMKSYHKGEINALERSIEFIENTIKF
jgi:hypothetical protein